MTKDDVIRLAKEAGFSVAWPEVEKNFIAFAKLVHQRGFMDGYTSCDKDNQGMLSLRIDDAVEEEREACAEICDRFQARDVGMQPAECAGAIRARSETTLRVNNNHG